jgi:hypothetical protein
MDVLLGIAEEWTDAVDAHVHSRLGRSSERPSRVLVAATPAGGDEVGARGGDTE